MRYQRIQVVLVFFTVLALMFYDESLIRIIYDITNVSLIFYVICGNYFLIERLTRQRLQPVLISQILMILLGQLSLGFLTVTGVQLFYKISPFLTTVIELVVLFFITYEIVIQFTKRNLINKSSLLFFNKPHYSLKKMHLTISGLFLFILLFYVGSSVNDIREILVLMGIFVAVNLLSYRILFSYFWSNQDGVAIPKIFTGNSTESFLAVIKSAGLHCLENSSMVDSLQCLDKLTIKIKEQLNIPKNYQENTQEFTYKELFQMFESAKNFELTADTFWNLLSEKQLFILLNYQRAQSLRIISELNYLLRLWGEKNMVGVSLLKSLLIYRLHKWKLYGRLPPYLHTLLIESILTLSLLKDSSSELTNMIEYEIQHRKQGFRRLILLSKGPYSRYNQLIEPIYFNYLCFYGEKGARYLNHLCTQDTPNTSIIGSKAHQRLDNYFDNMVKIYIGSESRKILGEAPNFPLVEFEGYIFNIEEPITPEKIRSFRDDFTHLIIKEKKHIASKPNWVKDLNDKSKIMTKEQKKLYLEKWLKTE